MPKLKKLNNSNVESRIIYTILQKSQKKAVRLEEFWHKKLLRSNSSDRFGSINGKYEC